MKHQLIALSLLLLSYAVRGQQGALLTELSIAKAASVVLKLDGYPDFLAPDGNDVWITNVKRIDKLSSKSNKPILSVPIPEPCGAMAVGFGAVWVANCSDKSIYRIDRTTGKLVDKIPTGLADKSGELSLAVGAGSIWVLSDNTGILSRIDPKKNKVQAVIKVLPFSYCAAFGYNAVWITNTGQGKNSGSVQRINPQTNKVVATISTGKAPRFLAVGENGVWTLNQGDGSVSRIDPYTNKLLATIDVKATGLGGDIAAGAGKVWVRGNKTVFLATIDPKKNSVNRRYGPISGSGAVRVTNDKSVWISSHDINTVWIIKPR